eukprot:COSAG01_NODE_46794_length_396_cov_30.592593_1_plen_27_part_10
MRCVVATYRDFCAVVVVDVRGDALREL